MDNKSKLVPGIESYPRVALDFNPRVPNLKKIRDKTKIDVRYALVSPFCFTHIYWDFKNYELVYDVEEPQLNEIEETYKDQIISAMRDLVNFEEVVEKSLDNLLDYIDKRFKLIAVELGIMMSYETYSKIYYYIVRDFVGYNEVDPLIKDYFVEDVECNGVDNHIYIVHRIFRNMRTSVIFNDLERLTSFIEKIAQRAGKYISYANPILDGSLPDGSRVNATYTKDITSKGPTFTIRKFTKTPWTPPKLLSMNTLSPEMIAYLWLLIEYKMNILITGGTASGKTTLLNAIVFFIPPEARIVSIEDSVTGDSKIIVKEKGIIRNVTIKEFVEKKIDAEVMTIDEKGKIIFVKPSSYIKHKVKKDIYEVLTSTGRKIKVTQDHSLFSLGEDGLIEIKPTDLKEGRSFIAVPRTLPIEGNKVNEINLMDHLQIFEEDFLCGDPIKNVFEKYSLKELNVKKQRYVWWKKHNLIKIKEFMKLKIDFSQEELKGLRIKSKNKASIPVIFNISDEFLEFCGLWLGDGSYDNYNKNSVIVSNVDKECRELIKKIAACLESNYSIMNDKGVSVRIHNSVFYKFMKYVIKLDGYSNSKKIPELIFNLSNEQIKYFIRGYFSADGTIKRDEISCSSQSYELLEDLQSMFLRLGIIARINDFNRKDKCINMSISSFENIDKFKEIRFLQERKNEKLNIMNKKAHHTVSDIIPLTITQLKDISKNHSKLSWPYLVGKQNIGRGYLQKVAIPGSEYNDLSHNDIYWDKVKRIKKIGSGEIEVFDLSIPNHEKFICNNVFVHNTRELNLPQENWLPSVARSAAGSKKISDIDLFVLLKSSFRQTPDYVIVGEVRGKETYVLFQGMASGHSSISTIHADSVDTVIKRLETPPIELSPTLLNVLDCVCVMTHAIVNKQETRKLREIVEIINVTPDGIALTNTPFVWNPVDDRFYFKKTSKIFEKISKRYGIRLEEVQLEFRRRTRLIYELYKKGIFSFEEVREIVRKYYKKPNEILKTYGINF